MSERKAPHATSKSSSPASAKAPVAASPHHEPRPHGESRAALLRAATKVFARNGFDGTTVKDLAEEAGVNVSLVSYYFGGKEGLFRTVLEDFGRERVIAAEKLLKAPASLEELTLRLGLFAENIIEAHLREPDLIKIIHRSKDLASPLTDHLFENVFAQIFSALQECFETGKRHGFLRQDFDTEIVTSLVFGSLVHFIQCEDIRVRAGKPSIANSEFAEKLVESWRRSFLHGLCTTLPAVSPESRPASDQTSESASDQNILTRSTQQDKKP